MKYRMVYTTEDLADSLIQTLGKGPVTGYGDRTSDYHAMACGEGSDDCLLVAIIENTAGLARPYYTLHIVDDISGEPCDLQHTDDLIETSLVKQLDELIESLRLSGNTVELFQPPLKPAAGDLLIWADYEYESHPLHFIKFKETLTSNAVIRILAMFDCWYGDTDQETTDWALEFQMLTRMLVRENALLVNPKYLEIPEECFEELAAVLRDVNPEIEAVYRSVRQEEVSGQKA